MLGGSLHGGLRFRLGVKLRMKGDHAGGSECMAYGTARVSAIVGVYPHDWISLILGPRGENKRRHHGRSSRKNSYPGGADILMNLGQHPIG